jgi:type IV pilus assembly protein PilF
MKIREGFAILLCLSLMSGCSSSKKNENAEALQAKNSYELPNATDYEKAARINIELAVTYLKQEQVSRAKKKFLKAKELAPKLPEVHYSYAYFLEHVGQFDDAKKSYEKAIDLNSKSGHTHNLYGSFLCRRGDYATAEKEFILAVADETYGQTAEVYENAGLCFIAQKDVAKATSYFEKALRYDPNRPNALLELAYIRMQQGNVAEARLLNKRYMEVGQQTARSKTLQAKLKMIS